MCNRGSPVGPDAQLFHDHERFGMKLRIVLAAGAAFLTLAAGEVPAGVRHYARGGHSERIVYRQNGRVKQRLVYNGYVHGFPPPAMLYYGYPGSGHSHGIGF